MSKATDAKPSAFSVISFPAFGVSAIGLGLLLRLMSLGRTFHLDELATLEQMQQPSIGAAMRWLREEGTHHPLFFFLFYGWHALCQNRAWLRLFPCLFDVATMILLFRFALIAGSQANKSRGLPEKSDTAASRQPTGTRMSRWALFVGMASWAVNPLALRFATEIRPYSALVFATVWLFWVCERTQDDAAHRATPWWLALAGMAAVWMHPAGFLSAAAVLFVFAVSDIRRSLRLWPAGLSLLLSVVGLHWGFSLDPSAQKISWMPSMSTDLFVRMVGVSYGLEDSRLYGTLSNALYLHGATGVALLLLLWAWARETESGQRAAAAAFMLLLLVAGYSVVMQPIFWYRSIAPAIALTAIGASLGLVVRPTAGRLILASSLIVWHASLGVTLANRAVDPCEPAARAAMAARQHDEPVYTFPDWLAVAFRYEGQPAGKKILPLDGKGFYEPGGVLFVRWEGGQYDLADGLGPVLQLATERGFAPHSVIVISNDNDDTSDEAEQIRATMLDKMIKRMPHCRRTDTRHDRYATLTCN